MRLIICTLFQYDSCTIKACIRKSCKSWCNDYGIVIQEMQQTLLAFSVNTTNTIQYNGGAGAVARIYPWNVSRAYINRIPGRSVRTIKETSQGGCHNAEYQEQVDRDRFERLVGSYMATDEETMRKEEVRGGSACSGSRFTPTLE